MYRGATADTDVMLLINFHMIFLTNKYVTLISHQIAISTILRRKQNLLHLRNYYCIIRPKFV